MRNSLMRRAWSHRAAVAGAGLYWSGLGRVFEALARPSGAIVIMYHSVADAASAPYVDPPNRISPQLFERQMAYLSRHRRVIALSQLVGDLDAGRTVPAGTVCLTFDDGYLDNLTVAAPILARYRLPATLYLPTGYIDRAESQWADVLHHVLSHRTAHRIDLPDFGLGLELSDAERMQDARTILHGVLLSSSYAQRTRCLEALTAQLRPEGEMPRLTLNWDEVRGLTQRYPLFEVGGHSRDHTDLRTHGHADVADELADCAAALDRQLGPKRRHFSFPYGRWNDDSRDQVQKGPWMSAVGSSSAYRIDANAHRYSMARIETPISMTSLRFMTSGAFPAALDLLRRR